MLGNVTGQDVKCHGVMDDREGRQVEQVNDRGVDSIGGDR
jgi:hypothetical protein